MDRRTPPRVADSMPWRDVDAPVSTPGQGCDRHRPQIEAAAARRNGGRHLVAGAAARVCILLPSRAPAPAAGARIAGPAECAGTLNRARPWGRCPQEPPTAARPARPLTAT